MLGRVTMHFAGAPLWTSFATTAAGGPNPHREYKSVAQVLRLGADLGTDCVRAERTACPAIPTGSRFSRRVPVSAAGALVRSARDIRNIAASRKCCQHVLFATGDCER